MTPETKAQYKADLERTRHERDAYRKRASFQRQEYLRLKSERKFLEALKALSRYNEYRSTSAHHAAEAARIRNLL